MTPRSPYGSGKESISDNTANTELQIFDDRTSFEADVKHSRTILSRRIIHLATVYSYKRCGASFRNGKGDGITTSGSSASKRKTEKHRSLIPVPGESSRPFPRSLYPQRSLLPYLRPMYFAGSALTSRELTPVSGGPILRNYFQMWSCPGLQAVHDKYTPFNFIVVRGLTKCRSVGTR